MTPTDIEKVIRQLPLPERAQLLARVQLTEEERDDLDDLRDLADPEVCARIKEASSEARAGSVRPARELLAESLAEEKRHAMRRR